MNYEDKISVLGFHIKEANDCYDKIREIKTNMRCDPNFRDHGDLKELESYLEIQIKLGYYAMIDHWVVYANLCNATELSSDDMPSVLKKYSWIRDVIRVLRLEHKRQQNGFKK